MSFLNYLEEVNKTSYLKEIVRHDEVHLNNVLKLMVQVYHSNPSIATDTIRILTGAICYHDVGLCYYGRAFRRTGIDDILNHVVERQMHGHYSCQLIECECRTKLETVFTASEVKEIGIACRYHQYAAPINRKIVDKMEEAAEEVPPIYRNLERFYELRLESDLEKKRAEILLVTYLLRFLDCCDNQTNRSLLSSPDEQRNQSTKKTRDEPLVLDKPFIFDVINKHDELDIEDVGPKKWKKIQSQEILCERRDIENLAERVECLRRHTKSYLKFLLNQPWHHFKHSAFLSVEIISNHCDGLEIVYTINPKFHEEFSKQRDAINESYAEIEKQINMTPISADLKEAIQNTIEEQRDQLSGNKEQVLKRLKEGLEKKGKKGGVVGDLRKEWEIVRDGIRSELEAYPKKAVFIDQQDPCYEEYSLD